MAISCSDAVTPLEKTKLDKMPVSHLGFSSKTIELNQLTFHYVEAGSGELILFLHGFPYFGESWAPLLTPLSEQYHVVAPDNRGIGYSEKPADVADYRVDKLVEDVYQMITQLAGDKPVVLIGHDWGGVLAWGVAQTHPKSVSKLVVINAPPFNVFMKMLAQSPSQQQASSYIAKLTGWMAKLYFMVKGPELMWGSALEKMHLDGVLNDDFKQAFMSAWQQEGAAEAAINWYKANVPEFDSIDDRDYWPSKDARVTVPSLLIWSKDDKAFTNDTFVAIADVVDQLHVKVIDTDSHSPFLDHTEEVLGYINEFIEK